jgi:very-short-patch-repair endonuclease
MATERQNFARKLRRQSTTPEDILWNLLRAHRLDGLKFQRQAPLLGYTVDFLCFQRKLVIEFDGAQHDVERDYDATRKQEIERHGFMVIRFRNEMVLNDRDAVLAAIREAAGTPTENPLL